MRYPFTVAAIDPGKKGSACKMQLTPGSKNIHSWVKLLNVISFHGRPDWELDLLNMLTTGQAPDLVAMENVHSKRFQGVKSMFTFGAYKGDARTVIKIAGHKVHWVEQTVWPRLVGLRGSEDKKERKAEQDARALDLFPELANVEGDIYASVLIAVGVLLGQCESFSAAYQAKYAPKVYAQTPEQIEYLLRLNTMLKRDRYGSPAPTTWEDLR